MKLVEGWLGISRCLKWHGVARGCRAGLDLCLAKSWYPVAVGDFNPSFRLFGVFFCFASFLSCSCFCSRRPPEACGEGSYDVSGADPEICWWRLCRWTTATAVSRSTNQPTNQPTKSWLVQKVFCVKDGWPVRAGWCKRCCVEKRVCV